MRVVRWLVSAACLLGISGCQHSLYQTSETNINQTKGDMDTIQRQANRVQPPVVHYSGYFADTKPVDLSHQPLWLHDPIHVHTEGLPFRAVLRTILDKHPVSVSLDASIEADKPISMRYEGTVQGALETLAHLSDYHVSWPNRDQLDWSAFETKSYDVSFMPGNSNYLVGQQANSNSRARTSGDQTVGESPLSQINDEQYSNLKASLSVWKDLKTGLQRIQSKEGHVSISEATTSVSVTDRPSRVRAMTRYIQSMNNYLSKEVLVRVQVLEIRLNKDFNYGVNWNAVANKLFNTPFTLTGTLADITNLSSNSLVVTSTTTEPQVAIGNTSQTVVKALSEQGQVRIVTQPQVMTLNNQMASIRITKNIGYIESVSQTQNEVGNFNTSSVVPGTVTDGFTLYVLPKIHGDRVFLQVSSTIANLDRLDKTSTIPTGVTVSSSSAQQFQAIQLPTLSQKAFNERSVVRSGDTLIMAGYKRLEDQTSDASLFGIPPLGGKGAMRSNIETLVLITPVIMRSDEQHVHPRT